MAKNVIKLNEQQLKKIVAESVKRVLSEYAENNELDDLLQREAKKLIMAHQKSYNLAFDIVKNECDFGLWWDMSDVDDKNDAKKLWQTAAHNLLANHEISYDRYAHAMHSGNIGDF